MAEQVDDDIWSAIGDPTRRRMLDLLPIDGDGTATSLGQQGHSHQAMADTDAAQRLLS